MSKSVSIKNVIAKSLGALWILDGLLQLQPKMFGADFVSRVLVPMLNDQPAIVRSFVSFGITLWSINPFVANLIAASIQIMIGALLLFPYADKKFNVGLWASVAWGVVVWVFGEGMGQLFTGSANFYTGAPGAALLYALLAALLLVPKARLDRFPQFGGTILLLGSALQAQFAPNATLICLPLVAGLLMLFKPNRVTGALVLAFLLFVWGWGQEFGELTTLFTGTSTDPNTAPLLALFFVPIFFRRHAKKYSHSGEI